MARRRPALLLATALGAAALEGLRSQAEAEPAAEELLSDQETAKLMSEAEGWRSGRRNGTSSLERAVEMYELAADRGVGRGARHGAHELGLLLEKGCRWPALGGAAAGRCEVARDVPRALERYAAAARSGHPGAQFALSVAFGSDAYVLGRDDELEALAAYAEAAGAGEGLEGDRARRDDVAVLHAYFASLGDEPLAHMALGARHLHGRGVPAQCDAALPYYEAAADAAVKAAVAERALRPNERARLSSDVGAPRGRYDGGVAALERAAGSWVGRLVDRVELVAEKRDRLAAALAAAAGDAPKPADPPAPAPEEEEEDDGDDRAWAAAPGAPPWPDADPFWAVQGAPDRGADVLHYYRHAADQDDAQALLALGHLHAHGSRGVAQDLAAAATYFQRAADVGDDPAAFGWAGLALAEGVGAPRDEARAEAYLRKGEALGDAVSLDGLGLLLLRRAATAAARDEARGYFRRSSEKGYMDALYHLGLAHVGWDGVATNEDAAVDAFAAALNEGPASPETNPVARRAAAEDAAARDAGDRASARRRGRRARDAAAGTPQQRRKDAQKALQFFSLAAQNGHVRALHKVGRMYSRAAGVRRSCEVAANAYKTVSERGPWVVQLAEAHAMYKRGDARGARRAYARLAEAGYEVAQSNAAWLLEAAANDARASDGDCDGLDPDACDARARRLYERAAAQGNAEASLKLGDFAYRGRGLADDDGDDDARLARAVAHYQSAHELRHAQATFALAWCYQRGHGVERDFHLAKRHYGLAADADADAAWPVRLAVAFLYVEWGLAEAARRRPALGRRFFSGGTPGPAPARSAHDAVIALLVVAGAALLALRSRRRAAAPPHEHQD